MARALGGSCVPNDGRWEVGPCEVQMTDLGKQIFGLDVLVSTFWIELCSGLGYMPGRDTMDCASGRSQSAAQQRCGVMCGVLSRNSRHVVVIHVGKKAPLPTRRTCMIWKSSAMPRFSTLYHLSTSPHLCGINSATRLSMRSEACQLTYFP